MNTDSKKRLEYISHYNDKRMNQLNLTKGTIITFDQEDKLVKDGKTISLVPGWKWMG